MPNLSNMVNMYKDEGGHESYDLTADSSEG